MNIIQKFFFDSSREGRKQRVLLAVKRGYQLPETVMMVAQVSMNEFLACAQELETEGHLYVALIQLPGGEKRMGMFPVHP
jgi:hypothetical protein